MPLNVGRRVRISERATKFILHAVADGGSRLETGGALFGFDDGHRLLITAACGPGPDAQREGNYFLRDLAYTQHFASEIFRVAGAQWIGEWHTHPFGPAIPSQRDILTYAAHLLDDDLNFNTFASIIVSPVTPEADVLLHFWLLMRDEENIAIYPIEPESGVSQHGHAV